MWLTGNSSNAHLPFILILAVFTVIQWNCKFTNKNPYKILHGFHIHSHFPPKCRELHALNVVQIFNDALHKVILATELENRTRSWYCPFKILGRVNIYIHYISVPSPPPINCTLINRHLCILYKILNASKCHTRETLPLISKTTKP